MIAVRGALSGVAGTVVPAATDFSDSLDATVLTVNGYSTIRSNALSSLRLQLQPGCSVLTAAINNNLTSGDLSIGVTIDGAFSTITPTSVSGLQLLKVAIDPSSAHVVEITHGWLAYGTGGSWIYAVSTDGGAPVVLPNPVVSRRLVVLGDSIATGSTASPLVQYGWIQRLRRTYAGRISMQGWGGATAGDWNGFASAALLAARLVGLCFGASTREIWDELGYNDWAGSWAMASVTSQLGVLYDAIHAADPGVRIWVQTPLLTGAEAATDSNGKTIAQFRTAKAAAASGRSWCTVVDGPTILPGNAAVHPNTAGHATLATNIAAILG